jgi:MIP family channel proteins
MRTNLRPLTAEFVGTLLFVFLGAGSAVAFAASGPTGQQLANVGVALAHGIALAVLVSATLSISGGHLNPAVTTGLWIANRIDGKLALQYIAAQLVGALAGATLVKAVMTKLAFDVVLGGTPRLTGNITFMQGVWIEAILTFFLVSAVFGTVVSPDAPKIAGFGVGLALLVSALVGGSMTGAALNPARAFGPALVAWQWNAHAVYWIGPLLGAAVAGALWKAVLLPKRGP